MGTCILDYRHRLPSSRRKRRVGPFVAEVNLIGGLGQFHDLASLDLSHGHHDENPAVIHAERDCHDRDYESHLDEEA